jgi:hypothetical protein
MSATMFIKPATEGAIVRMPERAMRPLAAAGEPVDDNFFWQRRLLHGDVVRAEPAEPAPAEDAAPAAASTSGDHEVEAPIATTV